MDDRDMIPAAGDPAGTFWTDSPTRPDIALTGALPTESAGEVSEPPGISAEWALWGKEAHETGAHVLCCSNGALRAEDFAEVIARYAPGDLAMLPQYTVSWIPAANRQPEYVVIGIHEHAPADPQRPDGRSRRDAAGRAIVFIRLFCMRYADVAELAVNYQDLVAAADQIQLPTTSAEPVTLTLSAQPASVYGRATPRQLAEGVAALLLTSRPVGVLGADDVSVVDRLRFIDTVMALLPYGLRSTMSASTWVDSTAQDLKLRLFFTSAPRAVGRLADGRSTAQDHLVDWANPKDIYVTGDAARLYQEWLKDVKNQAPDLLAEQSAPVRFTPADLRRMVGNLPRDKGILETLDELGKSLSMADKTAIRHAIKRLQRYLASGQRPADLTDYRGRVSAGHLLANDDRLSPQLKGELYGVLLPVAFGSPLTYADYCAVEDCAGGALHTPLRTAVAKSPIDDILAWILARETRPGARSDKSLNELGQHGVPAAEPLGSVARAMAARQLRPQHGPIVLDFAVRYLLKLSGRPGEVLARYGYLAPMYRDMYLDDQETQVNQLMRVLDVAFGAPLSRSAIDAVLVHPPTSALHEALLRLTDRRDHAYVEKQTDAVIRRSRGLPDRPALPRQRGRWTSRWPLGRQRRDGRRPAGEWPELDVPEPPRQVEPSRQQGTVTMAVGAPERPAGLRNSFSSPGSVWRHPKTTYSTIVVILVLCFIVYLVLQSLLLHG